MVFTTVVLDPGPSKEGDSKIIPAESFVVQWASSYSSNSKMMTTQARP